MPNITLRNIPKNLQDRLKKRSKLNRRSLNSEILACLEELLMPGRLDAEELIAESERLKSGLSFKVTEKEINYAIRSGRK